MAGRMNLFSWLVLGLVTAHVSASFMPMRMPYRRAYSYRKFPLRRRTMSNLPNLEGSHQLFLDATRDSRHGVSLNRRLLSPTGAIFVGPRIRNRPVLNSVIRGDLTDSIVTLNNGALVGPVISGLQTMQAADVIPQAVNLGQADPVMALSAAPADRARAGNGMDRGIDDTNIYITGSAGIDNAAAMRAAQDAISRLGSSRINDADIYIDVSGSSSSNAARAAMVPRNSAYLAAVSEPMTPEPIMNSGRFNTLNAAGAAMNPIRAALSPAAASARRAPQGGVYVNTQDVSDSQFTIRNMNSGSSPLSGARARASTAPRMPQGDVSFNAKDFTDSQLTITNMNSGSSPFRDGLS